MDFVIEKGLQYKSKAGGQGRKPTVFPLADMEVGDSFLIPCDTASKKAVESWRRKLLGGKKRFAKEFPDAAANMVFRTVAQDTDAGTGLRVFRVK